MKRLALSFLLVCFALGEETKKPPAPDNPKPAKPVSRRKRAAKKKQAAVPEPKIPAKVEPVTENEKKLTGDLLEIVRAGRVTPEGGAEVKAKSLKLLDDEKLVKVEVVATEAARVDAVKKAIEEQKGKVLVHLENHVFALIPLSAIEPLAAAEAVHSVATVPDSIRQ